MSLIVAVSRLLQWLQRRFPWLGWAIEVFRGTVFLADSLLSALLFLLWICVFGLPYKLWTTLGITRSSRRGDILFLSQEGFTVAPTRIRSYFFAEKLAALGYPTRVLAFWDHFYHFKHLPDRPIFGVEKTLVAIKAVHRLLANPPEIIIEQRPTYDLLTTWALYWLRGIPVVFDIDDWIGSYTWFYPLRVETVLPRFHSITNTCIVSSAHLEHLLGSVFPVTVKIPTYVDTDIFRPQVQVPTSPEVVFGWNGTLFQEFMFESILVMLDAFSRARDKLEGSVSIAMEIAGTGDYFPKLEELLGTRYAGYPIRLKGWLDPRKMSEYLDGIDVGLYSLVVTEARRGTAEETFIVSKSPTKVFEYMAKGLPTISTRVGEVGNVIEPGVTGICSDDLGELSEGFVLLARDAELRQRMGAAARTQCEQRFSMTTAAQQLLEVIAASENVSAHHRGIKLRKAGIDTAGGEKGAC